MEGTVIATWIGHGHAKNPGAVKVCTPSMPNSKANTSHIKEAYSPQVTSLTCLGYTMELVPSASDNLCILIPHRKRCPFKVLFWCSIHTLPSDA